MTVPSFPTLWQPDAIKRVILWPAFRRESISGKVSVNAQYSYPRRRFTLTFNAMASTLSVRDWRTVEGFYNQMSGGAKIFQYQDYYDNTVTDASLGTGDGSSTAFQLIRSFGGFVEPITMPVGTPTVKINGTPTVAFTLGTTGLITFTSPPGGGAALTWSGTFNWPCRFDNDNLEFTNPQWAQFVLSDLSFTTEKLV